MQANIGGVVVESLPSSLFVMDLTKEPHFCLKKLKLKRTQKSHFVIVSILKMERFVTVHMLVFKLSVRIY